MKVESVCFFSYIKREIDLPAIDETLRAGRRIVRTCLVGLLLYLCRLSASKVLHPVCPMHLELYERVSMLFLDV